MRPLFFPLPGDEPLAAELASRTCGEAGKVRARAFPDGETYLRLDPPPEGRTVGLVCTLDHPDPKLMPLLLAADAARGSGAVSVGLVAPYLAYMRQDRSFRPGEPVSARVIGRLISSAFDWLVTVEPHLHRIASLDQILTIPSLAVASAPLLAAWIAHNVDRPLIVGPDAESEPWAAAVGRLVGAPQVALSKVRRGDREVAIEAPDLAAYRGRRAVIIDDIVSSGATLIKAVEVLGASGFPHPACAVVHALFGDETQTRLESLGGEVASVSTVRHPSNATSPAAALAEAMQR